METLDQQVPGASTATGAMAGVGWKGVCARPVMRVKLRHLQDLPQLSRCPRGERPLVELYLEPGGLFRTMHGRVTAPSC